MNVQNLISIDIKKALIHSGAPKHCDPLIFRTLNLNISDYQSNAAMKIAKILKLDPYQFAKTVISKIKNSNMYHTIKVAKPGFINIILDRNWLSKKLEIALYSDRLDVNSVTPKNIVVDYSSPNIAKEMHIGHLRSTIIGDATVRIIEFLGHNVIRSNHIGDWGTHFGMLIAYIYNDKKKSISKISLTDIEKLYQKAKIKYDHDPEFAKLSKEYVVKLQNEDQYCQYLWKKLVSVTIKYNAKIYKKLNVTLKNEHIKGESSYKNMLPEVISDLKKKGIAVKNKGSLIVVLEKYKNRYGNPMGVVIQKKDGGYLYSIIDIACIKYRCEILKADKILYYTDSRQNQYLLQIWEIAKKASYIPQHVTIEHHMFGMMLSDNKRPFQTRTGNTIKLSLLLDEAIKKAKKIIKQKNPDLSEENIHKLSNIIGIGAIKYADLSKNRIKNYIFNWDEMLSFEGNTAPYIQYAYTRIMSIIRKSKTHPLSLKGNIILSKKFEIELALILLQFEEKITYAANKGTPHIICSYLYKLSEIFSNFYENCSILFAENTEISVSRLKLSLLTAKTIKLGLNLLGINTIDYM
ncbi:arginine--tRNA ligase [Buchnera aphidicola (Pemphigus obesinymphae)]|uniref:arginine--tRNA ligase n=1 Tax=Buchnera aphidicola TaxID=9 RepID=UPI002237D1FD|nr:arginine--tRNA ligase [Buchnera aphidicola]MCW5196483.1 arginine--tRNA ligase [Buchnera aphidicola (Pemphigus obesinymphae)]